MIPDRQSIIQSMIEGSLRAAADQSVTTVIRAWDYYSPGTTSQPLMPFLVVGLTDDEEIVHDGTLWSATCSIMIVAHWAESVRDTLDVIRVSVRGIMHDLPGVNLGGYCFDGVREVSCSEPDIVSPQGDVVLVQQLMYTVWYTAPVTQDIPADQEIYLAARDPETGYLYTTAQSADPRRITRWDDGGSTVRVSYAHGAWADRASLNYSDPVNPLSTFPTM
jgi:hypothetical protein